jgi:hypothetical protein
MGLIIGEVDVVNEVRLAPSAALYDGAVTADGDLTVKVNAFYYDFAGTHGRYPGSCNNAITDNATSYVYLLAGGTLGISTAGYSPATHIRLARVIAQGGIIVRIILERAFFTGGGNAVSASAKAGVVIPGAFSGSPKVASVAFSLPFSDMDYAITLSVATDGTKTFSPVVVNKTATGFDINLNANNIANLVEIGWHAMSNGG